MTAPQRDRGTSPDDGFTLIELLVVIGIIGILAAIAVIGTKHIRGNAVNAACKSDYKSVKLAIDAYYTKFGVYPTTTDFSSGTTLLGSGGLPKGSGTPPQYQFSLSGSTVSVLPSTAVVGTSSPTYPGVLGCTAK